MNKKYEIIVNSEVVLSCELYTRVHKLINILSKCQKNDLDFYKVNENCKKMKEDLEKCDGVTIEEVKEEIKEQQTNLF